MTAYTLTTFASLNTDDGGVTLTSPTEDAAGNIFGTIYANGPNGDGSVFEIKKDDNSKTGYDAPITIATFNNNNGAGPVGSLTEDANGDLFVATRYGGANGDGTISEIPKDGNSNIGYVTPKLECPLCAKLECPL